VTASETPPPQVRLESVDATNEKNGVGILDDEPLLDHTWIEG
jgi:hypothetical protein